MKKISVFLPNLKNGGAEKVFVRLASVFVSKGYKLEFVLIKKEGELLSQLPESVEIIDLNKTRFRESLFPLSVYLKESKPDVLIAVMWPLTIISVLAVWFSRIQRRDLHLVFSDHNIFSLSSGRDSFLKRLLQRTSVRLFYPGADICLAVSEGVAKDISSFSHLNKNEIFKVIHNPVENLESNLETVFNNKDYSHRVISVGNLKAVKDQRTLIDAFYVLRQEINAELIILGEGELRAQLEKQILELDLSDSVNLVGYQANTTKWYKSSDLFVLSSKHEGFGNVIVEALMCGVPVVSTDCLSGPREILGDEEYGKLVPVGDVNALAQAMLTSLKEKHDIEKLKKRAADFSVNRIADDYLDVMFPERLSG